MPENEVDHHEAKSIVERLIEAEQNKRNFKKELIKKKEQWALCVNRIASTPDGKYFLQMLVTHAEIFAIDPNINPAKLVEDRGRKEFYLNHVRPYLNKSNKNKIEV